eukprot:Rmarinus@m.9191
MSISLFSSSVGYKVAVFTLCLLLIIVWYSERSFPENSQFLEEEDLPYLKFDPGSNADAQINPATDVFARTIDENYLLDSDRPYIPKGYHFDVSDVPQILDSHWREINDSRFLCFHHELREGFNILFLHVYKAGGTTMRSFFHEYANFCDLRWMQFETIIEKTDISGCARTDTSCIRKMVAPYDVVSGHWYWPYHRDVFRSRRILLTTLRDAEEAAVSSTLFQSRFSDFGVVSTVDAGVEYVETFLDAVRGTPRRDFICRFGECESLDMGVAWTDDMMKNGVKAACDTMKTFDVVGLVEKWNTTIKMFQVAMDGERELPKEIWEGLVNAKKNKSLVSTTEVLEALPAPLRVRLREYVRSDQVVYHCARAVFTQHCHYWLGHNNPECELEPPSF